MAEARNDASLFGPKVTDPRPDLAQIQTVALALLAPHSPIHRASIISPRKQRVRGLQTIRSVLETLSGSEKKIWEALEKDVYYHVEATAAGVQVEYQLASIGLSELGKRTGLDRSTVRRGILLLIERHLLSLHEKSEAYESKPTIYRLCDPDAVAETMRCDDRLLGWRQKGRGRVLVLALQS